MANRHVHSAGIWSHSATCMWYFFNKKMWDVKIKLNSPYCCFKNVYLEKKENGQENPIQCFNSITCSKNTTPDLDYATTQGFKHCLWRLLPPSFDKTKTKCVKGSIPNTEHLLPNNPLLLLWDKWDWWLSKSLHLRHCIILLRKHWSLRSIPLSIIYCLC